MHAYLSASLHEFYVCIQFLTKTLAYQILNCLDFSDQRFLHDKTLTIDGIATRASHPGFWSHLRHPFLQRGVTFLTTGRRVSTLYQPEISLQDPLNLRLSLFPCDCSFFDSFFARCPSTFNVFFLKLGQCLLSSH